MYTTRGSWVNIDNKEEELGDLQLFHASLLTLKSRCLPFGTYKVFVVMEEPSSVGLGRTIFHSPLIRMPKAQFQHIRLLFVWEASTWRSLWICRMFCLFLFHSLPCFCCTLWHLDSAWAMEHVLVLSYALCPGATTDAAGQTALILWFYQSRNTSGKQVEENHHATWKHSFPIPILGLEFSSWNLKLEFSPWNSIAILIENA